VCDNKNMLLGLSNGHLQLVSWNAEVLIKATFHYFPFKSLMPHGSHQALFNSFLA